MKGDRAVAALLLDWGADPDGRDSEGYTPLLRAIDWEREDLVRLLLGRGAEVDIRSACRLGDTARVRALLDREPGLMEARIGNGYSLLHMAMGSAETVALLLDRGADAAAGTKDGWTPLHEARRMDPDAVTLLISGGADVNARDRRGQTPLWNAIGARSAACVKRLLAHGADPNVRVPTSSALDKDSYEFPIHRAASWGPAEAVRLLIEHGAEVDARDSSGQSALHFACDGEIAALLVGNGADVNAGSHRYEITPLHRAAYSGHKDVVVLLLDHGADVHAENTLWGGTALHLAIAEGHADVAALLRERGGDIHQATKWGGTLLHAAAVGGHADLVRQLLADGLDINARDHSGTTPLHYAVGSPSREAIYDDGRRDDEAWRPMIETARLLIESGADVRAADHHGMTPLHRTGDAGIAKLLIERGAVIEASDIGRRTPLYEAARSGYYEVVETLLDHGAAIESADTVGETPLWKAAQKGHPEIVRLLLDRGANINAVAHEGTPLKIAAFNNWIPVVELLLQRGADIHAKDKDGISVLDRASSEDLDNFFNEEMAEFLLRHGSKP
jgi:ankyrin repeat protein